MGPLKHLHSGRAHLVLYSALTFIIDRSKVLHLHGLFLICTGSGERWFQLFLSWTAFSMNLNT